MTAITISVISTTKKIVILIVNWNNSEKKTISIKLNEIKRTMHTWSFPKNTPRKYETFIDRLKISHTQTSHMNTL